MKLVLLTIFLLAITFTECELVAGKRTKHLRPVLEKRQTPEPIEGSKGGLILEGQNVPLDLQNPDGLTPPPTDAGAVVNLKWSFSLSPQGLSNGGWVRTQTVTDLPSSQDLSAAQNHLAKSAIRQMHWHNLAEWGFVTAGTVLIGAVNDDGRNEVFNATTGDIWYFPKGEPHVIQGMEENNEYLLVFDDPNFNAVGTTLNVDNWIKHTPPEVLAKNFGFNASEVFKNTPSPDPSILKGTASSGAVASPFGVLNGSSSFYFPASGLKAAVPPGDGGCVKLVDTRNFPIAKTIAAAIVQLKPGGLREMHWHPNSAEWLYFRSGTGRATVWLGNNQARTFDFSAGDTAVFPDNSGHYVENTSQNETLEYLEIFKADQVKDVSLTQWLALTPNDLVAQVLNISVDIVAGLKKEKQVLIA